METSDSFFKQPTVSTWVGKQVVEEKNQITSLYKIRLHRNVIFVNLDRSERRTVRISRPFQRKKEWFVSIDDPNDPSYGIWVPLCYWGVVPNDKGAWIVNRYICMCKE